MTPSSGLGSFFILRRRGVEQHGRPTVCIMIWTNNPLDKSGRRLRKTVTAAWFIIFGYFLSRGTPGKILLWPTFFWLRSWLQSTRQKQTVSRSIWQYPTDADNKKSTKYRLFIGIPWILLGAREGIWTPKDKPHAPQTCASASSATLAYEVLMQSWFLSALRSKPYRWLLKYNTILPRRCQAFS